MVRTLDDCAFDTERLTVRNWRYDADDNWPSRELSAAVQQTLTPAVTSALPPGWQGPYTLERASSWIEEREAEGTVLRVTERGTGEAVGLLLLGEEALDDGSLEARLGYLLAESAWGRGFATELVTGFVEWCRTQSAVRSIAGGVDADNVASRRVLEKCGFAVAEETGSGEVLYRLGLR